jgi:vancomycin resistance protein VanJ
MGAKPKVRHVTTNVTAMLVIAYALFVLAWLAARAIWGDEWWGVALLNTFPAWLFLPIPVALLLAAFDRRAIVWAAAAVPILIWLALFGWRYLPPAMRPGTCLAHAPIAGLAPRPGAGKLSGNAAGGYGAGPGIRVLALNVLYTNPDMDRVATAISAAGPDLIAMPELTPAVDAGLAERLRKTYPCRTLSMLPGAPFGIGIYSRWPFEDRGSLQTGLGLRSAAADVHTPQGVVRFVALHPWATLADINSYARFSGSIRQSFRDREAQLAAICRYVDQLEGRPLILAGDFNMTEFSDAYRCLGERLHDAYREVGRGLGNTWPAATDYDTPARDLPITAALTRIDYVFYSEHWRAASAVVLDDYTGSDHRPVIVKLEFNG